MRNCVLPLLAICLGLGAAAPAAAQQNDQSPASQRARLAELGRSLRWWDEEVSKKPYSWYRSEEGQRMADNILSWQDSSTGWPLMNTVREPFTGDLSKAGPWGKKAALVKATVNEMRFLARAFEPAPISGGESAAVLQFLMRIPKPAPEVIKAVEAGVQWYRDVQINGLELVQTADYRLVRPNPAAPRCVSGFRSGQTCRPSACCSTCGQRQRARCDAAAYQLHAQCVTFRRTGDR